jgi:hypothetical protein
MEDANRQPVYGAIIFRQQQGREVSHQEPDCPGCPFQVKIDNYLEAPLFNSGNDVGIINQRSEALMTILKSSRNG